AIRGNSQILDPIGVPGENPQDLPALRIPLPDGFIEAPRIDGFPIRRKDGPRHPSRMAVKNTDESTRLSVVEFCGVVMDAHQQLLTIRGQRNIFNLVRVFEQPLYCGVWRYIP